MKKEITCFEAPKIMEKALDVGEAMLCTGAEISRVEDTILRICHTYGGGVIDVFTILSLIILSWHTTDDQNFTQTRRIYSYSTDLGKLEELNALSRYICANKPSCDEIEQRVEEIMHGDRRRISVSRMMGYILGASAFAIFFGGNLRDGVAAGIVAWIFYFWEYIFGPRSKNRVVYTLLSSFAVGILCMLSVLSGIAVHVDKVMIGNIMLQNRRFSRT